MSSGQSFEGLTPEQVTVDDLRFLSPHPALRALNAQVAEAGLQELESSATAAILRATDSMIHKYLNFLGDFSIREHQTASLTTEDVGLTSARTRPFAPPEDFTEATEGLVQHLRANPQITIPPSDLLVGAVTKVAATAAPRLLAKSRADRQPTARKSSKGALQTLPQRIQDAKARLRRRAEGGNPRVAALCSEWSRQLTVAERARLDRATTAGITLGLVRHAAPLVLGQGRLARLALTRTNAVLTLVKSDESRRGVLDEAAPASTRGSGGVSSGSGLEPHPRTLSHSGASTPRKRGRPPLHHNRPGAQR